MSEIQEVFAIHSSAITNIINAILIKLHNFHFGQWSEDMYRAVPNQTESKQCVSYTALSNIASEHNMIFYFIKYSFMLKAMQHCIVSYTFVIIKTQPLLCSTP